MIFMDYRLLPICLQPRHVMTVFPFQQMIFLCRRWKKTTRDSIERKKFPLVSAKLAIFISIRLYLSSSLSLPPQIIFCIVKWCRSLSWIKVESEEWLRNLIILLCFVMKNKQNYWWGGLGIYCFIIWLENLSRWTSWKNTFHREQNVFGIDGIGLILVERNLVVVNEQIERKFVGLSRARLKEFLVEKYNLITKLTEIIKFNELWRKTLF